MQSGRTSKTVTFDRAPTARYYRSMAKARYHYNIMLRPEPEGGYTALVPALPGCVTFGRTVEEAREMAKDAISGYIASLRKHKDPIPTPGSGSI
jgi:antitoxin HicB